VRRPTLPIAAAAAFALGVVACSALVSLDGLTSGGGAADASPAPSEAGSDGAALDGSSLDGGADAPLDAALRPYVDEVLADGPASYWRLEDDAGVAKDEMGKFTGTYNGDGDHEAPGALRNAPSLAAEFRAGTITFPGAYAFAGRAPLTLEMWVMPAVVDSEYRHFFTHVTSGPTRTGYLVWIHQADGFAFERDEAYTEDSGVQHGIGRPAGLPTNAWSHVVATYDGTTMRLYMNGDEVDADTSTLSLSSTGSALVLGDGFRGRMDEVAVYTRALPADRVRAHYKAAGY